jgi:hypothetical protein
MVGGGADGLDEAQKRAHDTDDVLFNERNKEGQENHTDNSPEQSLEGAGLEDVRGTKRAE